MKTTVNTATTLEEAIEAGLTIKAVYTNGEVVKVLDFNNKPMVEFKDGTIENVHINDLIDFTWN